MKKAGKIKQAELNAIRTVFAQAPSVVFAYLYGSAKDSDRFNDIDIAVYARDNSNPMRLAADLKMALSEKTGGSPDRFDVRVINHLIEKGDLFSLLYLRNVLDGGIVLADHAKPNLLLANGATTLRIGLQPRVLSEELFF